MVLHRVDELALMELQQTADAQLCDEAEDCRPDSPAQDEETIQQAGISSSSAANSSTHRNRAGHKDGRGSYDRSHSQRVLSHAEQAWNHFSRVSNFSIGRPCGQTCLNERQCGAHIMPAVLMHAHEYSYGKGTSRVEQGDGNYKYYVEFTRSQTSCRWRSLAAAAMSYSIGESWRRTERLTVCDVGPVCQAYWEAAYGIPHGTAKKLLAAARAGGLGEEEGLKFFAEMRASEVAADDNGSQAATVQWWETWLESEDQMPNEACIQHRVVVWRSVYEEEYILDMQCLGFRALSRSRWVSLRREALKNLSLDYFGHEQGAPDVPKAMLSLVSRPKHSNFALCDLCAAAKEKWHAYRRSGSFSSLPEAS